MKLGNYAHYSISVHNLNESIPFYERIGFRKLWDNIEPHPWALLSDGRVNLHLFESYFPSPALHYFSSTMDDKIRELKQEGFALELQKSKDGTRKQHTLLDPNEFSIMLMHHDDTEMPKPDGTSHAVLGTFGELSINTDRLDESIIFWRKLDFVPTHSGEKPYPWALLSDGTATIALHQTGTFTAPAFTYFALNVAERINKLKADGIAFTHLMPGSGGSYEGAILNAPDGQLFFLLKGEA